MKSVSDINAVFDKVRASIDKWEVRDKLIFITALSEVADLANQIMWKYDGREDRMNEVIEALKGGNDD